MARLKEEVEHSKRIIHELRSELHTITLRAQTTTESTGRLDAKVVQLNHELDHERALVNRLKDEQLGKKDFHGSTTSTSQYTNLPHIFLTSSSHLLHIFLTSSSNLPRIFCLRSTDKSTSLTKLQSTVHTLEAERDMLHVRITGLVSATDQVSERRVLKAVLSLNLMCFLGRVMTDDTCSTRWYYSCCNWEYRAPYTNTCW